MIKKKTTQKIGAAALVALLIVSFYITGYQYFRHSKHITHDSSIKKFNSGWQVVDKDGKWSIDFDLPTTVENKKNVALVIENVLPEITKEYDTLRFLSKDQLTKVYVDGELIHSVEVDDKLHLGKTPGSVWNFIELDESYSGKVIRIELTSPYDECAGYISDFYIGDEDDLVKDSIKSKMFTFCLALCVCMLGTYFLLKQTFSINDKEINSGYRYLGCFILLFGIWAALDTGLIHVVFSCPPMLTLITFQCLMFLPIFIVLFFRETVLSNNTYHRPLEGLLTVCAINIVVQTILQVHGAVDFYDMVWVSHIIIIAVGSTCIFSLVKEYKREGKKEQKIMLNAIILLLVSCLAEVFAYYILRTTGYSNVILIGMIIFAILLEKVENIKVRDMKEKSISAKTFENLAYNDILTGFKNRTYFTKQIEEIDAHASLYESIAVVSLDMNNLKTINDSYGHMMGDKMLKAAAECIANAFEGIGEPARIGGDEYALIALNIGEDKIVSAIKKMRAFAIIKSEELNCKIEIACGYAYYDFTRDRNIESVYTRADKAMYKNKAELKSGQVTEVNL